MIDKSQQEIFKINYNRSVEQEAQFIVREILDCADQEDYQCDIYLDDVLRKARKIFEEMNA